MKATNAAPLPAEPDELGELGLELGTNNPPAKAKQSVGQGPAELETPAPAPAPSDELDMSGMTLEDCHDLAQGSWGWAFDEIQAAMPGLTFSAETREKAAKKTAPVLFKYRDKLPDWFKRYREEIELGMFVGGLAYGVFKAHRLAKAIEQQQRQINGAETQAPAAA